MKYFNCFKGIEVMFGGKDLVDKLVELDYINYYVWSGCMVIHLRPVTKLELISGTSGIYVLVNTKDKIGEYRTLQEAIKTSLDYVLTAYWKIYCDNQSNILKYIKNNYSTSVNIEEYNKSVEGVHEVISKRDEILKLLQTMR